MSDIGIKVLSSNLVANDEIKDAKNKEIELARKDGKNNVVLVNKLENGDAVVSRLDVQDIKDLSVGNNFESGTAKGQIVFIDDAVDDIVSKDTQKTNQSLNSTVNSSEVKNTENSMYNLSADQGYKFFKVLESARSVSRFNSIPNEKENIKKARTENVSQREKVEFIKEYQKFYGDKTDNKPDGVFGQSTFSDAKNVYINNYNGKDSYITDSEFKNFIDDAIKVFDNGITLENFVKKWDMEYK